MANNVLEINKLKTCFYTDTGIVNAVCDVSFSIGTEETVAVVGESGCGKSVTALSVMRLVPQPPGKIVSGEVMYNGENLLEYSEERMRRIRGNEISMIFQEPMTSLNPVFRIGEQVAESLRIHEDLSHKDAFEKAVEMLKLVGIPSADKRAKEYPYQLSGGMRQRVMIAMAFACNPKILIADEPTTALDVTIQAQILDLMGKIKERNRSSILLITHDLGIVAEYAQKVLVMYAGKIVEKASVQAIFSNPLHPYTQGLLASVPKKAALVKGKRQFATIHGRVPSLIDLPEGCAFYNRCEACDGSGSCKDEVLEMVEVEPDHWVRCRRYL